MGIIQLCLLQEYFKEWLKCILPCAPKVENLKGNQTRVFCYLRASPHQNIHFCLSQWSEHNGPLPNEHSEHNGKPGVFLANTFSRASFGRWGEVHHLSQQPPASLCILQSCHDWLQHFFFFSFSPPLSNHCLQSGGMCFLNNQEHLELKCCLAEVCQKFFFSLFMLWLF